MQWRWAMSGVWGAQRLQGRESGCRAAPSCDRRSQAKQQDQRDTTNDNATHNRSTHKQLALSILAPISLHAGEIASSRSGESKRARIHV